MSEKLTAEEEGAARVLLRAIYETREPGGKLEAFFVPRGTAEVFDRLLATLDAERARADAAVLAGVRAGIEAARVWARDRMVACKNDSLHEGGRPVACERCWEAEEIADGITSLDAEAIAREVRP